MASGSWDVEKGKKEQRGGLDGKRHFDSGFSNREDLHKESSNLSSLELRETQEESLARLASPIGVVSSILAGALVTLFLNPPQTIYNGFEQGDWIGCCMNMPDGTCWSFSVACLTFMFFATCCSIASLIFIVAATLKATAAGRRPEKLEGSTAAIANFIAAKWMLFACVYLTYLTLLLYVPTAYPIIVLIISAITLGVGTLLTVALFWGNFWKSVGEDLSMLRRFFSKKADRLRSRNQAQDGQGDSQQQATGSDSGSVKKLGSESSQPNTPAVTSFRQSRQWGSI